MVRVTGALHRVYGVSRNPADTGVVVHGCGRGLDLYPVNVYDGLNSVGRGGCVWMVSYLHVV